LFDLFTCHTTGVFLWNIVPPGKLKE
jgi:hypothetical protein